MWITMQKTDLDTDKIRIKILQKIINRISLNKLKKCSHLYYFFALNNNFDSIFSKNAKVIYINILKYVDVITSCSQDSSIHIPKNLPPKMFDFPPKTPSNTTIKGDTLS
ncbi:hypothetical protein EDEG_00521 [Edhazardia aedis USNM 41457]|uniref:Uncharacterized protein n=1 Tax=Edhazardia aedis (strain USNM 41457) TaxID=1003232 RepID=J9D080_EDHAE|nr:hypothetical protein EDEG_00521 [Edhazardia aedis USNM 41457]|eukprot:EJW01276.1 hypothetical protein EDEG_00521 [Edhazardia aedis USNM 41457]